MIFFHGHVGSTYAPLRHDLAAMTTMSTPMKHVWCGRRGSIYRRWTTVSARQTAMITINKSTLHFQRQMSPPDPDVALAAGPPNKLPMLGVQFSSLSSTQQFHRCREKEGKRKAQESAKVQVRVGFGRAETVSHLILGTSRWFDLVSNMMNHEWYDRRIVVVVG